MRTPPFEGNRHSPCWIPIPIIRRGNDRCTEYGSDIIINDSKHGSSNIHSNGISNINHNSNSKGSSNINNSSSIKGSNN